jgi:hypothetical protein
MRRTLMTSNLIERGASWWRLALLALLLALAGCGPGTGGTGTGPVAFGYSGSSGGAVFAPSAGAAGCDRICQINLLLEEQRVELESSCLRFARTGAWKADEQGLVVLEGTVARVTSRGTVSAPGTLRLQFSGPIAASSQVTMTLLDAAGATLLGPLQLRSDSAVTGGTAPQPSCSPT